MTEATDPICLTEPTTVVWPALDRIAKSLEAIAVELARISESMERPSTQSLVKINPWPNYGESDVQEPPPPE